MGSSTSHSEEDSQNTKAFFGELCATVMEPSCSTLSYTPASFILRQHLSCPGWLPICDPPASASWTAGITGLYHGIQL